MREILHILHEEFKKSVFTDDKEFIEFVNKIQKENEDNFKLETVSDCVSYIFGYCSNLTYTFVHPEQKENEILLLNVKPDEPMFVHSLPDWLSSVRLGEVAYATNGVYIVEDMKPLFGTLKQKK